MTMHEADRQALLSKGNRSLLERYCESRARVVPIGGKLLCRVLGDRLMYLDPNDTTLTPHLAMSGYWETWITQAIARHVQPGMVCLDIGANCGYFTVVMAEQVGADGAVHAFEPQPGLCSLVEMSATVNGYGDRVKVHCGALGEAEGEVRLAVDPALLGAASVREDGNLVVPQTTLDSYWLERVDFVKIDAEGSEPRILAGMRRTIEQHDPVILMEYARGMYLGRPDEGWLRTAVEGYRVRNVEPDASLREVEMDEIEASEPAQLWMLWLDRPNS